MTVSCGLLSGFHATQATIISRTVSLEYDSRRIFYGMMTLESLIAIIWAAASMDVYSSNLVPENIVQGITILGVEGSASVGGIFNFEVYPNQQTAQSMMQDNSMPRVVGKSGVAYYDQDCMTAQRVSLNDSNAMYSKCLYLDLTSYISNPKKKLFNLKSNSLNRKPLKSTQNSKQTSKNHSNVSEFDNSQQKNFLKNVIPKNTESKKTNHVFRNRYSLNLKTQNNSKEKGNNLKKNFKTNSLSKEKEKNSMKRNTNIEYTNNTKTLMNEPKHSNQKIIKNNNSINQSIKAKKNNLIGIHSINFDNMIKKNNNSKDNKKQKLNIKNFSINHQKQFKFLKSITTHNSKEKNTSTIKSSYLNKPKTINENSLLNKIPRKNLSIKI
jgi:hypothetical protein